MAAAAMIAAGVAFAGQGIEVADAWAPPAAGMAPAAAVYFTVFNRGSERDRLVGAQTPVAKHADLHTHRMEGDIARMRRLDSVEIFPGEQVEFAPGGLHLMLTGLTRPLREGETFPVTLVFERAGRIDVAVRVNAAPGMGMRKEMDGGKTRHQGM